MNLVGHVQVRHMIAGMSGGVVSTLLLHPLDLLKIRYLSVILPHILTLIFFRFAVDDGSHGRTKYTSIGNAMSTIV